MTTANRTGVSSGTKISRGVWAVKENRRPESVARARRVRDPVEGSPPRGTVMDSTAMDLSFQMSGGFGEAIAGEPQIDVVERGGPGTDGCVAQAQVQDGG